MGVDDTPKRPVGRPRKYGAIRHVVAFGVDDQLYAALPKNPDGHPDPDWCRAVFTAALPPIGEALEAVRKELEVGSE